MFSLKRYIAVLWLFIILMLLIHLGFRGQGSNTSLSIRQNGDIVTKNDVKGSVKTIQWFDSFHNNNGLRSRSDVVDFDQCEIRNKKCKLLDHYEVVASNGSGQQYGPLRADAVIFQASHLGEMTPPMRRDFDQVFVFAEREPWWHLGLFHSMTSPSKPYKTVKESEMDWYSKTVPNFLVSPQYYINTLKFQDVFNWTMTYRNDSDIPMFYGQILHMKDAPSSKRQEIQKENGEKSYLTSFNLKKLDVVWFVSHCRTNSKREEYVNKLKQHINVDIYGKCGQDVCPKGSGQTGCLQTIVKKYKFVLSFENTFYKDYVTEKLFDWFSKDIVPVVYGLADYKNIAPKGTIINAADFTSPKLLADYLKYVGSNRDEYMKYLRQKRRYYTVGHDVMQQQAYCQLCDRLHNLHMHRQSYPKIDKWWQLNDTSSYLSLYKQAVPPKSNNKQWTWFTLTVGSIFISCYLINYICKVSSRFYAERKV